MVVVHESESVLTPIPSVTEPVKAKGKRCFHGFKNLVTTTEMKYNNVTSRYRTSSVTIREF